MERIERAAGVVLKSPVVLFSAVMTFVILFVAAFAPWLAPYDPWNQALVEIANAQIPPSWMEGGDSRFLLGTDYQGRDVLSVIMYGTRISVLVGLVSVSLALMLGLTLGLLSGFYGGVFDAIVMRIADVQLGFPAILVALLVNGIVRTFMGSDFQQEISLVIVIGAIVLSSWVQFARIVRSATMVEAQKDYVMAARLIRAGNGYIIWKHIAPNVLNPILVVGMIQFATSILTEASLSYLGVGVSPLQPSLGTLIRVGSDYLFSGMWWIAVFPGIVLASIIIVLNLLGDALCDELDPKLKTRE